MTADTSPDGRFVPLGQQLIEIHDRLREDLARLRDDLTETGADAVGGRTHANELPGYCLAFCSVLRRHHSGEDRGVFAILAERAPDLRPVIDELIRDHLVVADALEQVADIGERLAAGGGPAEALRVELDGLAAILESHFAYEERRLVTALNSMESGAGSAEKLFGVSPNDESAWRVAAT